VVQSHDLLVDVGLESIVGVREVWEYVCHCAAMVVVGKRREEGSRTSETV
jgi:hypothetical protein